MPEQRPNAITRLYRACDPRTALEAGDPRYVNCDDVRGTSQVVDFAHSLWRADSLRPEVKIFAGHSGVGKTSELLRLKQLLENPPGDQRPFQVLFADVSDQLDLNDFDFPDLLAFLAAEAQTKLGEARIPGFDATSRYLSRLWDEFFGLLGSELLLKSAKAAVPYGPLALELRNRPSSRRQLRQAIEKQSTGLIAAVNDLLELATIRLREAGKEGLVLLVDGLDKLVLRDLQEEGITTHERLFVRRAKQLASLKAHVLYTVPISLIYSPQLTQLEQTFGEHHLSVPMIRLRDDSLKLSTATPGMQKLGEMLEARCRYAEVDFDELFDAPATCNFLCEMAGGHPRHLVMFLRTAINGVDDLPVTRASAEKAVRKYGNSLVRAIPDEFWPKLRRFGEPHSSVPTDPDHQAMLLLLYIFEYMNDAPWYEVNPVIRNLHKFREG